MFEDYYFSFKLTFDDAAEQATHLLKVNDIEESEIKKLYGLYKQSTIGNCNTSRPSFWNPMKQAKWDAWNDFRNVSQDQAKEDYIKLVEFLSIKYSISTKLKNTL